MDDPIETPVMDDEKSDVLVGATICFTPETSPVSSPNRKGSPSGVNAITTVCSLNSDSNNYIGSLHEDPMDHTGMESVLITKSSAVQIASSLDGRSITEYEVLDGIHSRGTIECEDLISEDGSGEHPCARSEMNTNVKGNLSGSITCPSLNCGGYDDLTLPTLASPFRDFLTSPTEKSHHVSGGGVGYSCPGVSDDGLVENERVDGGSVNSSPIDDRPLNAFMTLQMFWECRATLSSMRKSMVLRVLGAETLTDITATTTTITTDVPRGDEAGINSYNITGAATSPTSADMMISKSSEGNDPSDHTRTSLINRFADEVALEEDLLETEEVNINGVDCNGSASALNENALGTKTNSCVGIIAKCKRVIGTILSITASLCFLVLFVYICNLLPTSVNDVVHEEVGECPQHELIAFPSGEPTFQEDVLGEDASTFKGSWLAVSTVLTLMLGAIIFKPKNRASSPAEDIQHESSPIHIIGIWSEEEHRQFLEGYNIHGGKWKMVSKFVPTRSDTQVRAHGIYWLKVRSPTKMTRARVVAAPTPTNSSDNPMKKESSPSSVSSGKITPTKSNLSTDVKTPIASNKDRSQPIKGILSVKDRNRSSKHVTPKSEHKPRKLTTKQGLKSDPIKRVRIQAA